MVNYETIFTGNGLDVRFFSNNSRLEEIYKGYCEDDEIKNAKNIFLEYVKKYNVKYLLSDMSKFEGASPEIMEWVRDKWLLDIYDAGIRNIAMVLPSQMFGDFMLEGALGSTIFQKVKSDKFQTYDEAVIWCEKS